MNYLKQSNPENCWILDTETDSLTPTKIWVVVVKNLGTEEEKEFYDADTFNSFVRSGDFVWIGHNILGFDVPILDKLWGSSIPLLDCCDSLTLSYLYNPALDGGHSLEAWGQRLGFPKQDFSDWSHLSDTMVEYCRNDVRLTYKLYNALTEKMLRLGFSELSAEIEHKIRIVIDEQQRNGFWFDKVRGLDLLQQLRRKQSGLTEDIQRLFPPVGKLSKTGTFKRNKDGGLPAFIEKARDRYDRVVLNDNGYEFYSLEPFNIGSPKQRIQRLLDLGWTPVSFTPTGLPRVDEDALVAFSEASGRPEIRAIADWLVLQGRSSMLEGWINHCGPDSRIHGKVLSCGAATRRMVHSAPNSANIPSGAKAKYGYECRALWGIEPNKGLIQVGVDASGLENVGLLHYLNNAEATKLLTQPKPNDVHTMNARNMTEVLGFPCDREWAGKTSFFSLIFGAGDGKLGSIVKKGPEAGAIIRKVIIKNVPGLGDLIERVQNEYKRTGGLLRCIDGGFVRCPSFNAALNYVVQSSGAIVMKLACILLHEEAEKEGLWFRLLGTIHDEWQMETKEEDGDRLGRLAVWCITRAAEELKFNLPLYGEYKLGKNWAECH